MCTVYSGILQLLPTQIAEAVTAAAALQGGQLQEIRLYSGAPAAIVCRGRLIRTAAVCSAEQFRETVMRLCGNSLYAHSETIREGYILTSGGLRVGVCGRAVTDGGRIELVTDLTSLCIRIPARHPGAADDLLPYITRGGCVCGMLIWSPPGVGKTTVLREITASLAGADPPIRLAVVDTRQEITASLECGGIDVLLGYPRASGMEIAVRTMAPQAVICDEIAGDADADAVLHCVASGTAVIATAHAGCREDLMRRGELLRLLENGAFPTLVGLQREGGSVSHSISEGQVIL